MKEHKIAKIHIFASAIHKVEIFGESKKQNTEYVLHENLNLMQLQQNSEASETQKFEVTREFLQKYKVLRNP